MTSFNAWLDFEGAPSAARAEAMVVTGLEVSAVEARADLFEGYGGGRKVRRVYVRRGPLAAPQPSRLTVWSRM